MIQGLNFRTLEGQKNYFKEYEESLKLIDIPFEEKTVETSCGITHYLVSGDINNKPLVLLHAASCGSTIWYKNLKDLSDKYRVYSIDLITESSKSILRTKLKNSREIADWLDETFTKIGLSKINLCGLSIGGWNSVNYAINYPNRIDNLILISPIQTFSKMYYKFFFKIMKMGFNPTRENVEAYIGWGNEKEGSLPDSIIKQFTTSVMNVNPNSAFPKMIKANDLKSLNMKTLVLLGEKEFAYNINKAKSIAEENIPNVKVEIVEDACHLISVSNPDYVNKRIIDFID